MTVEELIDLVEVKSSKDTKPYIIKSPSEVVIF